MIYIPKNEKMQILYATPENRGLTLFRGGKIPPLLAILHSAILFLNQCVSNHS